ncbi:hypothetical protein NPIL_158581 [Nephila pilipes]|uniref:Uncharacterized protein n=1 Tax=Nephila pilipes TaxID=299642 RepID=A0A8X6N712_NEPPI|nr:hypothetical protein NPIL_158581 [Nephila pilipes]
MVVVGSSCIQGCERCNILTLTILIPIINTSTQHPHRTTCTEKTCWTPGITPMGPEEEAPSSDDLEIVRKHTVQARIS